MKKESFGEYTKNFDEADLTTECTICMVQFEEQETICVYPCDEKHFFHEVCGEKWLNQKFECPLCRKEFFVNPLESDQEE